MWVFRVILVAVFVCLAIYMIQVITNHGLGLFSVFFGDVARALMPFAQLRLAHGKRKWDS